MSGATRMLLLALDAAIGAPAAGAAHAQEADPSRDFGPNALGDVNQHLVFTPIVPCRIVDSRVAGGPMTPNETRDFKVVGVAHQGQGGSIDGCGLPSGPTSAVLNISAVGAAGAGHLRTWAYSTPPVGPPLAAAITFGAGHNFANGIPVPLCNPAVTTCPFDIRMFAQGANVHVVIDVMGYFAGRAVSNADVAPDADILESKLALNFPTHSSANDPTADEKGALLGTAGTPTTGNRFVTNSDARNTNARTPVVHGDALHDASVASLSAGIVPNAELGSGTASAATFLRGDRTWSTTTGIGGVVLSGSTASVNPTTVDSFTVTAPAAGTLTLIASGGIWLNCDATGTTSRLCTALAAICDTQNSFSSCAADALDFYSEDPDDANSTNVVPHVTFTRTVAVTAGARQFHFNLASNSAVTLDLYPGFTLTAIFSPTVLQVTSP